MYAWRPAISEDYRTIAVFPQDENELFHMFPSASYPLNAEQLESRARERLFPTVVLHGDDIAAYANLYDRQDDVIWLGNVVVAPAYRGQGAAPYLLGTMERLAAELEGVRHLRLSCHHSNPRGLLLYTKLGYRPYEIGRTERRNGDIVVLVRMEKELTKGGGGA